MIVTYQPKVFETASFYDCRCRDFDWLVGKLSMTDCVWIVPGTFLGEPEQ